MGKLISLMMGFAIGSVSHAQSSTMTYVDMKSIADIFTVSGPGTVGFWQTAVPYAAWKANLAGAEFPMNVSPVYAGMASGGVSMPPPIKLDPSKFQAEEQDFANFVNSKNVNNQRTPPLKEPNEYAKDLLQEDEKKTYVIQTVTTTVVDRSFNDLQLSKERLTTIAKSIDKAHFHYEIPGNMALAALDQDSISGRNFDTQKSYLLSVLDFRKYVCEGFKFLIDIKFSYDKFSGHNKQDLYNSSIYMVSDLRWNEPTDLTAAEALFKKRPTAILVQNVIYADHLAKGAENIFAFFAEGNKTRAVFVSNLGLSNFYFTGKKKELFTTAIFYGYNAARKENRLVGLADSTGQAYEKGKQMVGNLISSSTPEPKKTGDDDLDFLDDAKKDMNDNNKCDRGFAIGLIAYSKGIFSAFVDSLNKH
jgi:hypothetical protein